MVAWGKERKIDAGAKPIDVVPIPLDWWYISPQSGHIFFYTVAALNHGYVRRGYTVARNGTLLHVAYRDASGKIVGNVLRW